MRIICLVAILFLSGVAKAQTCIEVEGLKLEVISSDRLLMMKDGRNLGIIQLCGSGLKKGEQVDLRFFTPRLCSSSANDKFHLNGDLKTVCSIEYFK